MCQMDINCLLYTFCDKLLLQLNGSACVDLPESGFAKFLDVVHILKRTAKFCR